MSDAVNNFCCIRLALKIFKQACAAEIAVIRYAALTCKQNKRYHTSARLTNTRDRCSNVNKHGTDGQTDGQTDRQSATQYAAPSYGGGPHKKRLKRTLSSSGIYSAPLYNKQIRPTVQNNVNIVSQSRHLTNYLRCPVYFTCKIDVNISAVCGNVRVAVKKEPTLSLLIMVSRCHAYVMYVFRVSKKFTFQFIVKQNISFRLSLVSWHLRFHKVV